MDQFKPSTILVQEAPLQLVDKPSWKDSSGLTIPCIFQNIQSLLGDDLQTFIDSKIVNNKDMYDIDNRRNLVFKINEMGHPELAEHASYALSHVNRHEKRIDREDMQVVFADWTQSQMASAFVTAVHSEQKE